uniref:uncharacterized protein LOC122583776 n=1 Tax=Erigeron canadensis TaxID=72917 RepID=UPI001CB8D920|nr:uncharacterized protein LOC122583776 [Erigeron canadensis]
MNPIIVNINHQQHIHQPDAAAAAAPAPARYPRGDLLLDNRRGDYMDKCVPLYKASIKGDWAAAEELLRDGGIENLLGCSITENQETALHVASSMGQSADFVENLIRRMRPEDLVLQNREGNTAFCCAVIAGNIQMVIAMVERNRDILIIPDRENMMPLYRDLLIIRGRDDTMPLYLAALYGNHKMVTYLYDLSRQMQTDAWTDNDRSMVFLKCVEVNFFDVAQRILEHHLNAPTGAYVSEVLKVLARNSCAFDDIDEQHNIWKSIISSIFHLVVGQANREREATQLLRRFWGRIVIRPRNEIDIILQGPAEIDHNGVPTHPSDQILFIAAEMGNVNFLTELIRSYPDLLWRKNDNGQTIFHVAVSHRRESVYSLLYELGSMKDVMTPLRDIDGNNMLHLAGLNPQNNPYEDLFTTPFQMQRESLWFKEVNAMMPPTYRQVKNNAGQTPSQLFSENHRDLVSKSKKWIKGTTNQCMVAAALIATIGFSVVFTIPRGYDQHNGIPQFIPDGHLIAFVVLDAISFILSSFSILMFLSIVISRYTQTDFLESLPQKLSFGLVILCLSILTMMVAFGISIFILYHHKFMFIVHIFGLLVAIAVTWKVQYPLLVAVFHSTYGSRYLFKPKKRMLWNDMM